jgi:uncharacterized BrkB/YihY/UPF0761 family membrane protein
MKKHYVFSPLAFYILFLLLPFNCQFVSVGYMFLFSAKIKSQFEITNETNIAKKIRNVIQRVIHSLLTVYTVLQISVYKIMSRI